MESPKYVGKYIYEREKHSYDRGRDRSERNIVTIEDFYFYEIFAKKSKEPTIPHDLFPTKDLRKKSLFSDFFL